MYRAPAWIERAPAGHLLGRQTQETLGAWIARGDQALCILHDDAFGHRCDDRSVEGFTLGPTHLKPLQHGARDLSSKSLVGDRVRATYVRNVPAAPPIGLPQRGWTHS